MYKANEVIDITIETRNELLEVKKMLEEEISAMGIVSAWGVADALYKKIVNIVDNAIKREVTNKIEE